MHYMAYVLYVYKSLHIVTENKLDIPFLNFFRIFFTEKDVLQGIYRKLFSISTNNQCDNNIHVGFYIRYMMRFREKD